MGCIWEGGAVSQVLLVKLPPGLGPRLLGRSRDVMCDVIEAGWVHGSLVPRQRMLGFQASSTDVAHDDLGGIVVVSVPSMLSDPTKMWNMSANCCSIWFSIIF